MASSSGTSGMCLSFQRLASPVCVFLNYAPQTDRCCRQIASFFGGNRFCGFIKRAPRPRRELGVNRTAQSGAGWPLWALCERLALWLCARCSCSRLRSRAFWARRPAFASPRTFPPWRQPLRSRVLAASCNVGQHRRGDQDLEVRIGACGFPWRLLFSSRGSSRGQVVVSGHRRVTSMELHTCTSAALWASVGGRNDCRHGLACSFGAIG